MLKAAKVCLRPPARPGHKLQALEVNAILCQEVNAPEGEESISWILLTSLPIDTIENISTVLEWYLCRWQIEIYFRTLKTGCKIEEIQLMQADRLLNCLSRSAKFGTQAIRVLQESLYIFKALINFF